MAAFTTHAIIDVELAGLFSVARVKSMANKTFRRVGRIGCPEAPWAENLCDALGNRVIQHIPGFGVLILKHPSAVLILQNLSLLSCLNGSMAGRCTARARSHVPRLCCRNWLQKVGLIGSLR